MQKDIIKGAILVLVAVVVVIYLGIQFSFGLVRNSSDGSAASPYSAVYLSNGDMYFGKLSWFPRPRISNVWLLQKQVDQNNQPQFSVAEFSKAFWSPVDEIHLNSKQILWWARLRNDSQLVRAMDNPSLLIQQQQVQQLAPADTFEGPSSQPPSKK